MPHRKAEVKRLDDTFVDTIKAARILRISVGTLRQWRLRGTGPAYYKIGRTVRYKLSDLRDYCVRVEPSKEKREKDQQVQGNQDNS